MVLADWRLFWPVRHQEAIGLRHSRMVLQHQTRNLVIPGSMLRIAPE
jgi:hypothetical protein